MPPEKVPENNSLLLRAKLQPPLSSRPLVQRSQLKGWMKAAEHARLVLVRAPAGFGKTTLMVQWLESLREQGVSTAWLTLDEADNDPGRFLADVFSAIQKAAPELNLGTPGLDLMGEGGVPTGGILFLLDQLSSYQAPLTLFLDDFGIIKNPKVLEMGRQILYHLPPSKRIVLSTRRLPEVGLGKIRARGELFDIDVERLRFSLAETEQFAKQTQGLELDDNTVALLQDSTEGWVAGLQLSTLSPSWRKGSGAPGQPAAGNLRELSEYLAEDVLQHQSEEVQAFLLQTSILRRFSGSLCDALTGRNDSYQMLDYLERANLFLVPLDEERRWYRYHSLFSKFLRSRLELSHRDRLPELYRKASEWHAQKGEFQGAAEYALAAGDVEQAAGLMELCAPSLVMAGHLGVVSEMGDRLPVVVLDRHPKLLLAYGYIQMYRHQYDEALETISRAFSVQSPYPGFVNDARLLKGIVLFCQDRVAECAKELSDEFLAECADSKPIGYATLHTAIAALRVAAGRFDEALEHFGRAHLIFQKTEDRLGEIYSSYYEGTRELVLGRLQGALALCQSVLEDKATGLLRYSPGGTAVAVLLGEALYETGELEKAENLLTQHRPLIPQAISADVFIVGFRILSRLLVARGNFPGAMSCLTEFERLGAERGLPRAVASARLEQVRMALLRGDLGRAQRIFEVCDDEKIWKSSEGWYMPGNDTETLEISRLRLMIEQGQAEKALGFLRVELARAEAEQRFRQALLIRILMAKAYESGGQRGKAMRALKKAILFAQDEGFVRIFLDEGETLTTLLVELSRTTGVGSDEISSEYLTKLLQAMGAGSAGVMPEASPAEDLVESLTDREIKILELVAQGLSNEELGDKLYISKHTVRSHLRNIHSKLGAKNRTEAVSLARRYGYIK